MLNKWQNGLLKNKDVYKFLASRINEIPNDIINNGTDEEAIIFCIKNAKVRTSPHKSINFYSGLPHSRAENRLRLNKEGII